MGNEEDWKLHQCSRKRMVNGTTHKDKEHSRRSTVSSWRMEVLWLLRAEERGPEASGASRELKW